MVNLGAEARRVLTDLDVTGFMRLWPVMLPAYPSPVNHDAALKTLHMARTGTKAIALKLRQYSHQWLLDRGLPSSLPAEDRPPEKVSAVGIAVRSQHPEVGKAIQTVMEHAVLDAYADSRTDPDFVRQRMMEARKRERKALGLSGG